MKQQTTTVTNTVEKQTSRIANSFKKIGRTMAAVLSIAAIVSFGKSCIQLGSDLAEVQNVVDVTFGAMSKQVDTFSKNAITQFGLSELTAKKYMGTYGAMAKSFGIVEEAGYQMSSAITGLTGDVASFYNLSTDEAYTKLKSIFTGETESLKDLGVVMTQTALDQYALHNGLGKTTAKMTEQEKVMLRYKFVMNQLTDASGDFVRTSDGWANQTRVLALQFDQLKATIGQGLINAFTPVIQVINTILGKLQTLANYFKAFTQALFGHAGGGSNPVAKAADSMSSAAGSSGAVARNMGKAADSAKKMNDYTLGIDELNILNPEDESGSGGSGGGEGGGDAGGVPDFGNMGGELFGEVTVNPAIEEAVAKMLDMLEKLREIAKPTTDAIKKLWDEGLAKLGTFAWTVLGDFYNEFLVPVGVWVLGEGLPGLIEIVNNLLNSIDWNKLIRALKDFWIALAPFAVAIGDGLLAFVQVLAKLLTPAFAGMIDVFSLCLNGLENIISAIPDKTVSILAGAIAGLATSVWLFNGIAAVIATVKGIGTAFSAMMTAMVANPILLAAGAIGTLAGAFLVMQQNWNNKIAEEYEEFVGNLAPSTKDIQEHTKKLQDFSKSVLDISKNAATEGESLDILKGKYFELADKITLTREEQGLLQYYAKELIKKIPELNDSIDTTTGRYKGQKDEIIKLIDAQKGYQMALAYGQILSEYNDQLATTSINLKRNQEESQNMVTEYAKLLKAREDAVDAGVEVWQAEEVLGMTYEEAAKKLAFYEEGIDNSRKAQILYRDEITELETQIGYVTEALSESTVAYQDTQKAIDDLNFSDMTIEASNAIDEMHGLWSKDGIQILGQDAIDIYNEITSTFDTLGEDFYTLADGSVVKFGKAIEDGTPGVVNTLDKEFLKSINTILSTQGKIIGTENGKLIISDFITGADSKKEDLKTSFEGYAAYSEEGFRNKMKELQETTTPKAMKDFATLGIMNPFMKELEINSPSKVFSFYAKNVIDGFNNGIEDNQGTTKGFISTWVNKVKSWFTDLFDINSPSGIFAGYGAYLVEGLNEGIADEMSSTLDKLNSWGQIIEDWVKDFYIKPISIGVTALAPSFTPVLETGLDVSMNRSVVSSGTFRKGTYAEGEIISAIREAFNQNTGVEQQNDLLREQNSLLSAILDKDTSIQVDGREIISVSSRVGKRQGFNFRK